MLGVDLVVAERCLNHSLGGLLAIMMFTTIWMNGVMR